MMLHTPETAMIIGSVFFGGFALLIGGMIMACFRTGGAR